MSKAQKPASPSSPLNTTTRREAIKDGGKVAVYTGILPICRDENGVAVVMGHEIAHAIAEHGSERMSNQLAINMGGIALSEAVKSQPELAVMREAARLADHVMATAVETIGPGVRQTDLAATISAAQYGGTAGIAGDYPAIVPLIMTGEGSSAPHITARVTPIDDTGITVLELTGVRHRYHCPISRTVHLGEPPKLITDTVAVVADGMAAVVAEMRAGLTAEDVHAAWRRTAEPHGITKASRIGYAVGLGYPPDWGESTISIRRDEPTVLEENQTVHIMLGIWNEDWGVSISNVVRVGANEGETLAATPLDLIVK